MRGFLITLLFSGWCLCASSQKNELGLMLGLSGFTGDVGKVSYFNPKNSALGLIYKYNAHERYAIRFSLLNTKLEGDDSESSDAERLERGYSFTNPLWELSGAFEFNFVKYDVYSDDTQVIPYAGLGVSYFYMNKLRYKNNTKVAKSGTGTGEQNIPIIVGVKSNFASKLILGAEFGARYALSDNLDGSFFNNKRAFGNTNSKDWYFFYGFTATLKLGGGKQKSKNCRCPF